MWVLPLSLPTCISACVILVEGSFCRFRKGRSAEDRFDDCADAMLDFQSFQMIEVSLTADDKCWSLIEG